MTPEQIKHMVDRFLGWKLPDNFNPDAGISYTRPNIAASHPGPCGTNLLDATQADAMVRHIVEGIPPASGNEHLRGLLSRAADLLGTNDDAAHEAMALQTEIRAALDAPTSK